MQKHQYWQKGVSKKKHLPTKKRDPKLRADFVCTAVFAISSCNKYGITSNKDSKESTVQSDSVGHVDV
jgi:hypothetical protein